ncbi:hypothetical protein [Nocardia sp. NPDC058480]|uniref:hypothetical protein n=1 Tax=unclassified Nocardia TaxID=2637762 RepID=UPI0036656266
MLLDDDYASLVPNPPTRFGLTELRDSYVDAVADEEVQRPMAEERRAYFEGLCGLFELDLPTSRKALGWSPARYVHGLVLNSAKSLLRTGSPWDGYLEAGALIGALDDLGIGEAHRSMVLELRTTVEASRSQHRALLDLLLTGLLGERAQVVFTLVDLEAAGIERAVPIRNLPD